MAHTYGGGTSAVLIRGTSQRRAPAYPSRPRLAPPGPALPANRQRPSERIRVCARMDGRLAQCALLVPEFPAAALTGASLHVRVETPFQREALVRRAPAAAPPGSGSCSACPHLADRRALGTGCTIAATPKQLGSRRLRRSDPVRVVFASWRAWLFTPEAAVRDPRLVAPESGSVGARLGRWRDPATYPFSER